MFLFTAPQKQNKKKQPPTSYFQCKYKSFVLPITCLTEPDSHTTQSLLRFNRCGLDRCSSSLLVQCKVQSHISAQVIKQPKGGTATLLTFPAGFHRLKKQAEDEERRRLDGEEQERARREQARRERERRQQEERKQQAQQLSRMREEEELRRRGETGDGA